MDYVSDGSDLEVEFSSESESLSDKSVFSSDLIYQEQSTSGCQQTKYKDLHGYLETSASDISDTDFHRIQFQLENWQFSEKK